MNVLKLLKKVFGGTEQKVLQGWERLLYQIHSNHIIIVNAGKVNAGKSSLFNILLDKSEEFKTGPVRETTKRKPYLHNNVEYIDTPGLEADNADTKEAFEAYKYANIILFLHNVQSGEYHAAEIEYIKKVMEIFPHPEDFIEKTIFLATHIDAVPDQTVLDMTCHKMVSQLEDIFASNKMPSIMVHKVSAKRYQTGKEKDKKPLMDKSGIPDLQKLIENRILFIKNNIGAEREQEFNGLKAKTVQHLNVLKQKIQARIQKNQEEQQQVDEQREERLEKISEKLRARWKYVRDKRDEVSRLERQLRNL